jgi:hypothetical protein
MQPLRWFRSNNGVGVWLAFFAVACQLVLTFGHVHFAGAGAISMALASAANPAVDGAPAPASQPQRAQGGLAQDFCAVCHNIGLGNTLVLPVPPDPVSPVSVAADLRRLPAVLELASQHHFHFSARGPPRA